MIGQVFLTVFAGVLVFVGGQIFVRFVIEPIQEFYKLTGRIAHSLIYYADIYNSTDVVAESFLKEAHEVLRQQASDLYAHMHMIPWYRLWAILRFLPPLTNANQAGPELMGLSNGVYDRSSHACTRNMSRRRKIEKLLNLKTGE